MTYSGEWGREETIKAVQEFANGFQVQADFTFGLDKKYGFTPKVGDKIQFRTRGVTYILGVKINGAEVFNRSDEEDKEIQQKEREEYEKQQQEAFERDREKMDRDCQSLPPEFQRKLERLRKNNPNFRWQYEPYELFCLKEAHKISLRLKDPAKVKRFSEAKEKVQKKLVPNLKYKEHSGNTFGIATQYAHFYLTNPRLFHLGHGAMAGLVGCRDYGCFPASQEELEEAGLDIPTLIIPEEANENPPA